MNLFAYGTLRDPVMVFRVIGHMNFNMESALLTGYEKEKDGYWVAYKSREAGAMLGGVIITDLAENDFVRLDRYEGVGYGTYKRVSSQAKTMGGEQVAVEVYVADQHALGNIQRRDPDATE